MKIWYLLFENRKLFKESPDNWLISQVNQKPRKDVDGVNEMQVGVLPINGVNEALAKHKLVFKADPSGKVKLEELTDA